VVRMALVVAMTMAVALIAARPHLNHSHPRIVGIVVVQRAEVVVGGEANEAVVRVSAP
jgi:hypothetical protein